MGMQYLTGFDFAYTKPFDFSDSLGIPSNCAFSQGQSLETRDKFSKDYTNTPQSVTRCVRSQAKTYTISYRLFYPEYVDLFSKVSEIEDSAGRTGHLYYSGLDLGLSLIQGVSLSFEIDAASVLSAVNVSLNVVSALQPKKPAPKVNIKTLA